MTKKTKNRPDVSTRRRQNRLLYGVQGGLCLHCGTLMLRPGLVQANLPRSQRRRLASREHMQCRADGGTNDFRNLALAHVGCNHDRGLKSLTPAAKVRRNALWAILDALAGPVSWLVLDRPLE